MHICDTRGRWVNSVPATGWHFPMHFFPKTFMYFHSDLIVPSSTAKPNDDLIYWWTYVPQSLNKLMKLLHWYLLGLIFGMGSMTTSIIQWNELDYNRLIHSPSVLVASAVSGASDVACNGLVIVCMICYYKCRLGITRGQWILGKLQCIEGSCDWWEFP